MARSEYLQIRIDEETRQKLKKLAEEDNRTVSSYVLNLILKEIKKSEQ